MERTGAYPAYLHLTKDKHNPPRLQRMQSSPPWPSCLQPHHDCAHCREAEGKQQKAMPGCALHLCFGASTVPFLSVSVACTNKMSPDPPRTSGPSSPCNKNRNTLGMAQAPFGLVSHLWGSSSATTGRVRNVPGTAHSTSWDMVFSAGLILEFEYSIWCPR